MVNLNARIIDEKYTKLDESIKEIPEKFELDIYNINNPGSVVNMLASRMQSAVISVPEPLRDMTHDELRKLVKPDSLLTQLRLRFWYAYDEAVFTGKQISIRSIVNGICIPEVFIRILADKSKLAFILTPIVNYEIQVHDFLETSLHKMRTALDKIEIESSKDLLAVLKVYEVFDKRVNGDYKKNINKTVTVENKTSEEIRNRIGVKKKLLIEKEKK